MDVLTNFTIISDLTFLRNIKSEAAEAILSYLLSRDSFQKIYLAPQNYNDIIKIINDESNNLKDRVAILADFKAIFRTADFIGESSDVDIKDDLKAIFHYLENIGETDILFVTDDFQNINGESTLSLKEFGNYCASLN